MEFIEEFFSQIQAIFCCFIFANTRFCKGLTFAKLKAIQWLLLLRGLFQAVHHTNGNAIQNTIDSGKRIFTRWASSSHQWAFLTKKRTKINHTYIHICKSQLNKEKSIYCAQNSKDRMNNFFLATGFWILYVITAFLLTI